VQSGDTLNGENFSDGTFPVFGGNGFRGLHDQFNTEADTLLIGRVGALCGNVHHVKERVWATEHAFRVRKLRSIETRYLFYLLLSLNLGLAATRSAQPVLNSDAVRNHSVPLPDLDTQKAIT